MRVAEMPYRCPILTTVVALIAQFQDFRLALARLAGTTRLLIAAFSRCHYNPA
jgi:hypothetical protein